MKDLISLVILETLSSDNRPVQMLNAIFFDFDGVILESVDLKKQAFGELYRFLGDSTVAYVESYHNAHGGVSRYDKILHFNRRFDLPDDDLSIQTMADQFSAIVLSKIQSCPFVEGALPFLEKHNSKLSLFVVSATPEAELKDIMRNIGIESYFKGIYGSPNKKQDILQTILTHENWLPSNTIFVGDALTDLEAASGAGVPFLGRITPGQNDPFPNTVNKNIDVYKNLELLIQK